MHTATISPVQSDFIASFYASYHSPAKGRCHGELPSQIPYTLSFDIQQAYYFNINWFCCDFIAPTKIYSFSLTDPVSFLRHLTSTLLLSWENQVFSCVSGFELLVLLLSSSLMIGTILWCGAISDVGNEAALDLNSPWYLV